MAVPKRRTSRSRKGTRRSHHHRSPVACQYCTRCGAPVLGHRVCGNCGYLNSQKREVVDMSAAEE